MSDEHDIDITGIDRATLLMALYAHSHVQGLGILQAAGPFSREQAQLIIETSRRPNGSIKFDYVRGRPIKVWFEGDKLSGARLYDRDNGHGLCARIVADLRTEARNPNQAKKAET